MGQCYFSGSNSGAGFHNYFDGIVPPWAALQRYFMIKGGPGVGKSTLMKLMAAKAEGVGEEVELFYCSGDPDSLDGVRLVKRGLVFADATAPHAMDPKYPGAVEEIVNLGEQINRSSIVKHREKIEGLTKRNKAGYRRAYAFLGAAAVLETERYREIEDCIDREKVKTFVKELAERIGTGEAGQNRYLFLDGISCKGRVSFAKECAEGNRVYCVAGVGKEVVTDCLAKAVRSDRKELFCSPLRPQCVNHLLLRDRELFLTSETGVKGTLLMAEDFFKRECNKIAEVYYTEARRLEEEAVKCLKECKQIHDELEAIYKECVDFAAINERTEKLLTLL